MKKENALVIGRTGFFGYHICKTLHKKFKVFSLSKSQPTAQRKLKNVKYLLGDIRKLSSINFLNNHKFKYVINSGGYVDHINEKLTKDTHFIGIKNLYKIFSKSKIELFVQIGSSSEYGRLSSPISENKMGKGQQIYGKSKLLASNYLMQQFKRNNFPVVILRFFQIYGPFQNDNRFIPFVIQSCIKNKSFPCSECLQSKDFIFISDALNIIKKCIVKKVKARGLIFNVGNGKPSQLKKVIFKIKKITKGGTPLFGKIKTRKDDFKLIFPNISKAKKILQWSPKTNLDKGLLKTVKFYKKHINFS